MAATAGAKAAMEGMETEKAGEARAAALREGVR